MKHLYALLSTVSVCMSTLWGTLPQWQALIPSAIPTYYGIVTPISLTSYSLEYPIIVESGPSAVAITPNGRQALVTNTTSDNLSVLDLTASPVTLYDVPMETIGSPTNVAITSDGTKAVVICSTTQVGAPAGGQTLSTVVVLDMTTAPISVASTIQVAAGDALAITPDGRKALVGLSTGWVGDFSPLVGILGVVDLTTTPVSIITTAIPFVADGGLAVTPDGTRALAVTKLSNTVTMIDMTAPIPQQLQGITVGPAPIDLAITPDGNRALVIFSGGGGGVSVLDLTASSLSVETLSVSLGATPTGIAITPDGKRAIVTVELEEDDPGSNVIFLDLTTAPVSILVPPHYPFSTPNPTDIAITPDQAPTAQFSSTFGHKGKNRQRVHFDASASTSPIGDVARYEWKFGDGSTVVTTSPTISHIYRHPKKGKRYHVRLTVTNTGGTSTDVTFTGRTVSNNGGASASIVKPLIVNPRS